jgi:hypothetical protein
LTKHWKPMFSSTPWANYAFLMHSLGLSDISCGVARHVDIINISVKYVDITIII